ncbi:MAG: hypothetical protein AB1Z67_02535 [Candidatus Limnocylindrales bacterium]
MRRPLVGVRRDQGQRYLSTTIVAFAVTVILIREYLDLAGYPKVGGGTLHVAHMLWGGLLLVVAAILVQLFVGRRALALSALAAGVGTGLFIDEVGKFITESNDYFFAPAAPIIYGAVLLLVLLWLLVRRERRPTPAEATHGAIGAIRDLADGRLSAAGRDRAIEGLEAAGVDSEAPGLAADLLTLLRSEETGSALASPGWLERGTVLDHLRRLIPDRLENLIIRIGLLLNTLGALVGLVIVAALASGQSVTGSPDPAGPIALPDDPFWLALLGVVWLVVGAASGVAFGLSLLGRHDPALTIAQYSLLIALVAGGLVDTYVEQLGALSSVIVQLALLALVLDQRSRRAGRAHDRTAG